DEVFESTALYQSQFLATIGEKFADKNVLVVLAFLGLVVDKNYADIYFKGNKMIVFPRRSTRDVNIRSSPIKSKQFHAFGQYIKEYSEIRKAMFSEAQCYFMSSDQEIPGVRSLRIHKHVFIDELAKLLRILYDEIESRILVDGNPYNVLFRTEPAVPNAPSEVDQRALSMMPYKKMVDVYNKYYATFIHEMSPSVLTRCHLVFPRVIGIYFCINLQSNHIHALGITLQTVFPEHFFEYPSNGEDRNVIVTKVSVTRQLIRKLKLIDIKDNTRVLLPVLLSYTSEIHLTIDDRMASLEELIILKKIIKGHNITSFVASIFDIYGFSFHYFVEETSLDKEKVLVLDLSECSLEEH
ncbi:hypothetical protein VCUG_02699, partial [Vavraia culicis subsp. floridensis]